MHDKLRHSCGPAAAGVARHLARVPVMRFDTKQILHIQPYTNIQSYKLISVVPSRAIQHQHGHQAAELSPTPCGSRLQFKHLHDPRVHVYSEAGRRLSVACALSQEDRSLQQDPPSTSSSTEPQQAVESSSGSSSSDSESSSSDTVNDSEIDTETSESSIAGTPLSQSLPSISVKVLSELSELKAVALLRAEAYYEHDRSRFAASFKKQFAAQEVESLRQRTAPTTNAQRPQLCDCLVAVDTSGSVVGCIDIRLPESCTQLKTIGVPAGDTVGCYLLNVVVAEDRRGLGVGKQIMRAAMHRAVQHWGAKRLYTHVEVENEVADRLYRSCGFKEHSSETKYANASSLGRLVLLMATAEDVQV